MTSEAPSKKQKLDVGIAKFLKKPPRCYETLPTDAGTFVPDWLSQGDADGLLRFCRDDCNFKPYIFRRTMKPLKRSPKCEFATDGTVGVYKWGQNSTEYNNAKPMPTILQNMIQTLPQTPTVPNHVIVIQYLNGMDQFQPHHRDKQDGQTGNPTGLGEILHNSSIQVVSVGVPRRFELKRFRGNDGRNNENNLKARHPVVWDCFLPHGSLLTMTAHGNNHYTHAVPRDSQWQGPRYSLVFRTIKTKEQQIRI
jgi:alkylated DNA repair dioxygenase AlkB